MKNSFLNTIRGRIARNIQIGQPSAQRADQIPIPASLTQISLQVAQGFQNIGKLPVHSLISLRLANKTNFCFQQGLHFIKVGIGFIQEQHQLSQQGFQIGAFGKLIGGPVKSDSHCSTFAG